MSQRQFGAPRPGLAYRDRPAAYGLLEKDARLAVVRVTLAGQAPFYDLPGGGIDDGESEAQALVREFGEETGLSVQAGAPITRGDQYMLSAHDEPFNSRGAFYEAVLSGERPDLKTEDDHELEWLSPHEALVRLRHDSHAWAVTAWLRR
jgi:8-oxo-dGTP diphosphatase